MFFLIKHTAKIRANHLTAINQCVKLYGQLAILTLTSKNMIPNFKTLKIGVYVNTIAANLKNTPKTKTMKWTFQIISQNEDGAKTIKFATINRKCRFAAKNYLQAKNPKSKIELI